MKQMATSAFKAKCLSLVRHVGATRESILVTFRGKPIARLVPAEPENDDIFGFMRSKGRIVGDIIAPLSGE